MAFKLLLNMEGLKIIGILLIYFFIRPANASTLNPANSKSAKPRIDTFDEILRPPPLPPNLATNQGAQRYQRQNKQVFPSSQGSYGVSQFSQERYPLLVRSTEPPSFFQKVSNWLFSRDSVASQNYGPPPNYGSPPSYVAPPSYGPPNGPQNGPQYGPQNGPQHGQLNGPQNGPPGPSSNYIAAASRAPPLQYGAPHSNGHQAYGPPPSNGPNPSYGPPPSIRPSPTYGAPPNRPVYGAPQVQSQKQKQDPKKKDCNHCNQFPWIPVLRYQSPTAPDTKDKLNFNPNAIGTRNNEPAKLSSPSKEPPKSLESPSQAPSGSDANGKPFSLSQVSLEYGAPTSIANNYPITNSYGTPIPSDTYGSPTPQPFDDNDPSGIHLNHGFDSFSPTAFDGRITGHRDNLQNLESNRISLITKPTNETRSNQGSGAGKGNNDSQFPRSVYPVANAYDKNKGIQILQPIPLPNLSPVPIPPLFNARPFKNYYINDHKSPTVLPSTRQTTTSPITHSSHSHNQGSSTNSISSSSHHQSSSSEPGSNVQFSPSIPLAEFTSSVDYPISIIQSPLLEIDTGRKNSGNEHTTNINHYNFNNNPIIVPSEDTKISYDSHSASTGGNRHNFDDDVHKDPVRNTFHFLPTPNSIDVSSNGENNKFQSISYSYIDQTFSTPISTTSSSLNHKPDLVHDPSEINNLFKPVPPQSLQSLDSPLLYLKPNIPHKDSKAFSSNVHPESVNILTSGNDISSTTIPIISPSPTPWNSAFRYLDNGGFAQGRWPPPVTDFNGQPITQTTKKPKRIQIIIPYTSDISPSPFQYSNDLSSSTGWVPLSDDLIQNHARKVPSEENTSNNILSTDSFIDYHQSSESKIVTKSSSPLFNTTAKYNDNVYPKYEPSVQATVEPPPKQENKSNFDMIKLQQNIDDWTAQEYSKIYKRQQKSSTSSHLKRSKKIPEEYFTTTPAQQKPNKSFPSTINELLDSEAASSIHHSIETDSIFNDTGIASVKNELYNPNILSFDTKNTYYTSTRRPLTMTTTETTTTVPKTTTRHSWEKIQTSISPLTKEKIYVVTPLPWGGSESAASYKSRNYASSPATSTNKLADAAEINKLSFKSPRFLVRPTPGPTGSQKDASTQDKQPDKLKSGLDWLHSINNLEETTTDSARSRDNFGLSSVTAYTSSSATGAVQTYSGHSKVITVVTPSTVTSSMK